jgi:16S rRNA (uracil1498-N3)-methyltransferase
LRTNRLHTAQALEPGHEVVLENGAVHYLCRVLRVVPGQSVTLFNGDGHDYEAEVLRTGRRDVLLRVTGRQPGVPESRLRITVAQALSRGERMDQTLQKCTELGAAAFQPLISERAEVRLQGDRLQRRLDHWRGVVVSACQQCGRARIPEVPLPRHR